MCIRDRSIIAATLQDAHLGGARQILLDALTALRQQSPLVVVNLKRLAPAIGLSYGTVRNTISRLVREGVICTTPVSYTHLVLIVYGSTTGNTEALAEILGRLIQEAGHETILLNAADASAPGLCDGWDMILFGCSAWGDDEIILQDDFDALFQQFDLINAKGHKVACFATGDSNFTDFCGAVDVIEAALERLGADVVVEGLKIDGQARCV